MNKPVHWPQHSLKHQNSGCGFATFGKLPLCGQVLYLLLFRIEKLGHMLIVILMAMLVQHLCLAQLERCGYHPYRCFFVSLSLSLPLSIPHSIHETHKHKFAEAHMPLQHSPDGSRIHLSIRCRKPAQYGSIKMNCSASNENHILTSVLN